LIGPKGPGRTIRIPRGPGPSFRVGPASHGDSMIRNAWGGTGARWPPVFRRAYRRRSSSGREFSAGAGPAVTSTLSAARAQYSPSRRESPESWRTTAPGALAVIAGIRDAKAVDTWARGERTPPPEAERRLRLAFHSTQLLLRQGSADTVRAWIVGMNPDLDERAPALLLAEHPGEVLATVQRRGAFRELLARLLPSRAALAQLQSAGGQAAVPRPAVPTGWYQRRAVARLRLSAAQRSRGPSRGESWLRSPDRGVFGGNCRRLGHFHAPPAPRRGMTEFFAALLPKLTPRPYSQPRSCTV
jgi:hypothetical protein